jgi:hypothetical protein
MYRRGAGIDCSFVALFVDSDRNRYGTNRWERSRRISIRPATLFRVGRVSPGRSLSGLVKLQVPRLRFRGFPVEIHGVDALLALERRTRGLVQCCGQEIRVGMTKGGVTLTSAPARHEERDCRESTAQPDSTTRSIYVATTEVRPASAWSWTPAWRHFAPDPRNENRRISVSNRCGTARQLVQSRRRDEPLDPQLVDFR